LKILIIGEYDHSTSVKQLQLIAELITWATQKYLLTFRPHPVSQIRDFNLPEGVSLSRTFSIDDDLAECDAVFCSNVSSAPLKANLLNKPVLMFRDGRSFNLSPLTPGHSVTFVNQASDLAAALAELDQNGRSMATNQIFPFFLDESFGRWHAILNSLFDDNGK